jgi:glutaminyl-peptide cyclotransferase
MIPSDREIKLALRRDFIRITPPPPDTAFSSTAIDLTLHEQISVWLADRQHTAKTGLALPAPEGYDCGRAWIAPARGLQEKARKVRLLVPEAPVMSRWAGGLAVLALLGLVVTLLVIQPWNGNAEPPAPTKSRDSFASDRPGGETPIPFDARRAMGYLEAVCKIGPRISGTPGMKQQQELLEKHFKDLGARVVYQNFIGRQRSVREATDMANLVVSWHPARPRRCILCSHYDTRPLADQEPDTRRWRQPFVSANDGGSSVALLMEMAHHMKDLPVTVGVDFVFFDGEEFVYDRDDEYFLGSKYFGRDYRKNRGKMVYTAAVLLDMVGGKDARFPIERNSWNRAAGLVRDVWGIAAELKATAFRGDQFSRVEVLDDHIPLNQSGIPAVDVVDFDYRHWHRLTDLPENCSGESLEQVAQVLAVWLQRMK